MKGVLGLTSRGPKTFCLLHVFSPASSQVLKMLNLLRLSRMVRKRDFRKTKLRSSKLKSSSNSRKSSKERPRCCMKPSLRWSLMMLKMSIYNPTALVQHFFPTPSKPQTKKNQKRLKQETQILITPPQAYNTIYFHQPYTNRYSLKNNGTSALKASPFPSLIHHHLRESWSEICYI